jgi:hypothetical protein
MFWLRGDLDRAWGCIAGSLFLGMVFGLDDFRAFLNGKKRYGAFTAYHVGLQTVVTGATVTALILSQNFVVVLVVNLATRGLGQLICVGLVWRTRTNDNVEGDFTAFGNRLSALSALGSVSFHLDRVLIGSTFALAIMADYNLAAILTNPLRNLGVMVNRLIFPKMLNQSGRQFARKVFAKSFYLIALLAGTGAAFYFAFPFLLNWVFPKYTGIAGYANWMMAAELVAVLVIYLETYYLSQDKLLRTYYFVNFARPILILVCLPIALFVWGLYGAILTKLIIRAIEAIYLLLRLHFGWDNNNETVG